MVLLSPCEDVSSKYLLSSRELIGNRIALVGKKCAEGKENRFQKYGEIGAIRNEWVILVLSHLECNRTKTESDVFVYCALFQFET